MISTQSPTQSLQIATHQAAAWSGYMSGLISFSGTPVNAATRGTWCAGTRLHWVIADGPIARCSANLVTVVFWRTFCREASYLGMAGRYAGILHHVNPQNICIAKKRLGREDGPMANAAYKVEIGRRLRMAIEAKGLTQVEVCDELGVSPPKLGNWLRGANYPDQWFVKRFCDRYGFTTDWIYRGVVSEVASGVAGALWTAAQASEEAK